MDTPELIEVLKDISIAGRDAAVAENSEAELTLAYTDLRWKLECLNRYYGWASSDDFATQVPSIDSLRTMRSLETTLAAQLGEPAQEDPLPAAVLRGALRDLSGWAVGTWSAYETL